MLDKSSAQKLGEELKIDLFTVYREYLQLLFLKHFYHQPGSEKVFFKGGTALRFLFGSFRFSEDLDFTSLIWNKEELKRLLDATLTDLSREIEAVTFKEGESLTNSFTGRVFQNLNDFKLPLTIRLDFSLREKPLRTTSSFLETIFPVGPYFQISHLSPEEILAEKVRAIMSRTRGRDVFDLWFLLSKKVPLDWGLISEKMAFYQRKADLPSLVKTLANISPEEIKSDLTKFLPLTHRELVKTIKELALAKLKKEEAI